MPGTSSVFDPADYCPWLARLAGKTAIGTPPSSQLILGKDDMGVEFKVFGATSGCYMLWDESENTLNIISDVGAITSEDHSVDINSTGTLASGKGLVGLDVAVTTAGTAGAWASGIYAKVTQGSTKNVDGYISGAEFEVVNTAGNASAFFPLVLNITDDSAVPGSTSVTAYIAIREYGSRAPQNLFWFGTEYATPGTKSDTSLLTTRGDGVVTHGVKFSINGVPYWFLCSNAAPSGT